MGIWMDVREVKYVAHKKGFYRELFGAVTKGSPLET